MGSGLVGSSLVLRFGRLRFGDGLVKLRFGSGLTGFGIIKSGLVGSGLGVPVS